MNPKRVGFLGYDGVQDLDLVGPLEAFMTSTVSDCPWDSIAPSHSGEHSKDATV